MSSRKQNIGPLLDRIKKSVLATDPEATIYLYGSRARGDYHKRSDVDLLILLNKENVTWEDERRISFPLYAIEFDSGTLISPLVLSKMHWESEHAITPFYHKVIRDAKVL